MKRLLGIALIAGINVSLLLPVAAQPQTQTQAIPPAAALGQIGGSSVKGRTPVARPNMQIEVDAPKEYRPKNHTVKTLIMLLVKARPEPIIPEAEEDKGPKVPKKINRRIR